MSPEPDDPDFSFGAFPFDEIEALDQLLVDFGARSRDLRDLEALDGFVTACVIGPRRIPCAELLPLVWPEATHWDSDEEKDRAFALTSRWYEDVVAREDAEPPESAPPFVHPLFEPDDGQGA